jgi:L-ascorbate metabolism protein UlaG (beta-lactamase superfamily)
MKNLLLLACSIIVLTSALYAQKSDKKSTNFINKEISVIYLGHSGWAIKSNNNFLIFDYQEKYGSKLEKQLAKNLLSGYINPAEIKDYNVFVFTSHEHIDHYDPLILNWDKEMENITYFFGWDFSSEDKYHCLKTPRAEYKDETIEVYTVNSHHSGVFESAFLIKIDGIIIYHNGDYKGDYKNDYEYLKSKTKKIDIAFSNCDPDLDSHLFDQSIHLVQQFGIKDFFPMHNNNQEKEFKLLAKMYEDQGVQTKVNCAEIKGDKFILKMN